MPVRWFRYIWLCIKRQKAAAVELEKPLSLREIEQALRKRDGMYQEKKNKAKPPPMRCCKKSLGYAVLCYAVLCIEVVTAWHACRGVIIAEYTRSIPETIITAAKGKGDGRSGKGTKNVWLRKFGPQNEFAFSSPNRKSLPAEKETGGIDGGAAGGPGRYVCNLGTESPGYVHPTCTSQAPVANGDIGWMILEPSLGRRQRRRVHLAQQNANTVIHSNTVLF